MQALQQLGYRVLPASFLANNTQNQQFLDHFNQYVYQEWSSYYFAYDLLKKEYRRIKYLPTACMTYERQIVVEMKRVHLFLASMLLEIEEDVHVISQTVDTLQRTLHSSQSHDELQQAILEEEQKQYDEEHENNAIFPSFTGLSSPKKKPIQQSTTRMMKQRGSYKKVEDSEGEGGEEDEEDALDLEEGQVSSKAASRKTLRYLAKSMHTISAIARKVETIVLDDDLVGQDKEKRKEKQIDRNIEQAIRSLYTILNRCEMFYKLNCYAISKVGKRMEKLYKRRPQRVDTIVEEEEEEESEDMSDAKEIMREMKTHQQKHAMQNMDIENHIPHLNPPLHSTGNVANSDHETVVEDMTMNPLVQKILSLDDSMEEVVVSNHVVSALSDNGTDSDCVPTATITTSNNSIAPEATYNALHTSTQPHRHAFKPPHLSHPQHKTRPLPHKKADKKSKGKHKTAWKDTPSGAYFYEDFASVGLQIQKFKQTCVELYSVKFKKSHAELAAYELEFIENKDRNYKDTRSFIGFKAGLILCSVSRASFCCLFVGDFSSDLLLVFVYIGTMACFRIIW